MELKQNHTFIRLSRPLVQKRLILPCVCVSVTAALTTARNIWTLRHNITRLGWVRLWVMKKFKSFPAWFWLLALVMSHSTRQRAEPRGSDPGDGWISSCMSSHSVIFKSPDCTGQLWNQCINRARGPECLTLHLLSVMGERNEIRSRWSSSQPGKKSQKKAEVDGRGASSCYTNETSTTADKGRSRAYIQVPDVGFYQDTS